MNPALHRPTLRHRSPTSRGESRGFTLIELMTVVVIIGIFAAIALPSVASQLRERKASNVAQQLTQFYRTARMRAAGRGSAVLVRYDSSGSLISMREAIAGATSANKCTLSPIASCTNPPNRWDSPTLYRTLDLFNPFDNTIGREYEYTRSDLRNATTSVPNADICFTPGGRTYYRESFASTAFTELDFVPSIRVWSVKDGAQIGPDRFVYVLPNGVARIGL